MKLNIIITFLIFFLFGFNQLFGQQLPLFSMYGEYQSLINPAYGELNDIGNNNYINIGTSYRNQWSNLSSLSPKTILIQGDILLETGNKFDLQTGFIIMKDQIGALSTTAIYTRISTLISTNEGNDFGFSMGLLAGIAQSRLNAQLIRDNAITNNDPNLPSTSLSSISPDLGIGFNFYNNIQSGVFSGDRFQIGISIPQLFTSNSLFTSDEYESSISRNRHIYMNVAFEKKLTQKSTVTTLAWFKKTNNLPSHLDLQLVYNYSQQYYLGIGVNTAKAILLNAALDIAPYIGLKNNILKVGYSYGSNFAEYQSDFGASHEVSLRYTITNTPDSIQTKSKL